MMILAAVQFGINVALIWLVFRLARNLTIYKGSHEEAMRMLNEWSDELAITQSKRGDHGWLGNKDCI